MEERLLEYEERKRLRRIQAVQKQNREAREMATRGGSSAAASSAAAGNRLYHEAQKKKHLLEQQLEQQAMSQFQQNSFQPTINKTSEKLAQKVRPRHVAVEDSLAYRGQLSHHKAQVRQQRSELQAKILANEPKINPTSERILREKYGDGLLEGGAGDRLARPIGTVRQRTREGIDEPTFQPQLMSTSSSAAGEWGRELSVDGDMYNRSRKWLEQKERRLERERREQESSELKQCSFRPQLAVGTGAGTGGTPGGVSGAVGGDDEGGRGGMTIAERQNEWAAKRYKVTITAVNYCVPTRVTWIVSPE